MNGIAPYTTMAMIGPGILAVFAIVFFCAWLLEKKRPYLLLHAIACILFTLGSTVQILFIPAEVKTNAILSGFLHTSAVLAAVEGLLRRSGKRFGLAADLAILLAGTGALWYFAYIQPMLLARVYIQNFGYGAILLVAALRLIPPPDSRFIDRILFWILLIFALHFFPRTILTIDVNPPSSVKAFSMSTFWHVLQLSLAVLGSALAFAILAAAVSDVLEDLRGERDVDPLTGLLNRRGFSERLQPLLTPQAQSSLTLILCDFDRFKSINDTFGHSAGDEVLKSFGAILRDEMRPTDFAGRLGGEEFAVLLPGATMADAAGFAERIRSRLEHTGYVKIPVSRPVTASFGIAEHRVGDDFRILYERADEQLYSAKAQGRNRIAPTAEAEMFLAAAQPATVSRNR